MKLVFDFKQFREDFNLFLFNHPKISFEDMKIFNNFMMLVEKLVKRGNMNGNKN